MTGSTSVSRTMGIVIAGTLMLCCFAQPAQAQVLDSISDAIETVKTKVTDIQTKVNNIKEDVNDSADQKAAAVSASRTRCSRNGYSIRSTA